MRRRAAKLLPHDEALASHQPRLRVDRTELKTLLDEQQRETQHLLDEQRRLRGVAEESQGQLRRALAENAAMKRSTPTAPPDEPLFVDGQKIFGHQHDCATIEAVRAAHQEVRGLML